MYNNTILIRSILYKLLPNGELGDIEQQKFINTVIKDIDLDGLKVKSEQFINEVIELAKKYSI